MRENLDLNSEFVASFAANGIRDPLEIIPLPLKHDDRTANAPDATATGEPANGDNATPRTGPDSGS